MPLKCDDGASSLKAIKSWPDLNKIIFWIKLESNIHNWGDEKNFWIECWNQVRTQKKDRKMSSRHKEAAWNPDENLRRHKMKLGNMFKDGSFSTFNFPLLIKAFVGARRNITVENF